MGPTVSLAVEGASDVPILRKIIEHKGGTVGPIYIQRGKDRIDAKIKAYNAAAAHGIWLVIRDMDSDADCPGILARAILPSPQKHMCFRVAVRSIESWILADRKSFAAFYGVNETLIPRDPDQLSNPKQTLLNLAKQSTIRRIRDNVPPHPSAASKVGPEYVSCIEEFAQFWKPNEAAHASLSLRKCLQALQKNLKAWPT